MRYKPNLAASIERHRRTWFLEEPLDRVPCTVWLPEPPRPTGRGDLDGAFYGDLEAFLTHREECFRVQAPVGDDWFPTVFPQYGHALISALCGSPIRAEAGTVWSVPIIDNWDQVASLRLDLDNEYGRQMQQEYAFLLEWAEGKCGVSHYETEGVSDTMAALRGTQQLCQDYLDSPEEVDRFAAAVTDILTAWAQWNFDHVAAPQRHTLLGGTVSNWCLWHPWRGLHMAEDATVLISPATYRRFIKEHDRRLTAAFPRSLCEVHEEGNHQIPEFAEVEGFGLLTLQNPLHMSPRDLAAVRPLFGRKALRYAAAPDEIEPSLRLTGTRGITLVTSADTLHHAHALLQQVAKWTHDVGPDPR